MLASNATGSIREIRVIRVRQWQFRRWRRAPIDGAEPNMFRCMTHIAFLGTGLLGSGLAEASAKRGNTVTVWNRTAAKARALEQFGIRVADTPADAVRGAERVQLVLKDDAVVEDVIAGCRPGLAPDTIIIDHTTTQPALTARSNRTCGFFRSSRVQRTSASYAKA